MSDPRIIVALDFSSTGQALFLVDKLDPKLCLVKVGKELFTAATLHAFATVLGMS